MQLRVVVFFFFHPWMCMEISYIWWRNRWRNPSTSSCSDRRSFLRWFAWALQCDHGFMRRTLLFVLDSHTHCFCLFPDGGRAAVIWQAELISCILSFLSAGICLLPHLKRGCAVVGRAARDVVGEEKLPIQKEKPIDFLSAQWQQDDFVNLIVHVKSCWQEARMRSGLPRRREQPPRP